MRPNLRSGLHPLRLEEGWLEESSRVQSAEGGWLEQDLALGCSCAADVLNDSMTFLKWAGDFGVQLFLTPSKLNWGIRKKTGAARGPMFFSFCFYLILYM